MLKRGDRLTLYHKGTRQPATDPLTIHKLEPAEGGIKVWIEEPLGETGRTIDIHAFVIVVGDDEYEIASGWKKDQDNWGYVLRPL